MTHEWFTGYNWDTVSIVPPAVPVDELLEQRLFTPLPALARGVGGSMQSVNSTGTMASGRIGTQTDFNTPRSADTSRAESDSASAFDFRGVGALKPDGNDGMLAIGKRRGDDTVGNPFGLGEIGQLGDLGALGGVDQMQFYADPAGFDGKNESWDRDEHMIAQQVTKVKKR